MPKVFLSHSSKDKLSYVKPVVDRLIKDLGTHSVIYDEYTFEAGMKSMEEIERGLNNTDLFVVFLSNSALESDWVKLELSQANELLNKEQLERIYPIIIDKSIDISDKRIPEWLEIYNLRFINRAVTTANMIKERLREISWKFHPRLKEKEEIFVGRNDYIKAFEERIDSLDKAVPVCFIASGIKNIGRAALLKHCFYKAKIVPKSHQMPVIYLDYRESLEDFIYKLYDLGYTNDVDLSNFINISLERKKLVALQLIKDIQQQKQKVFIRDEGCIVNHECQIADWFLDLLDRLPYRDRITFGILSKFRVFMKDFWRRENIYTIEVAELEKKERDGLLKRYLEFEELSLEVDDKKFISNLLKGYPEQVFFAVDIIKQKGITYLKNESNLLASYNREKIASILMDYETDNEAMEFLYLLSGFDYISIGFILEVVENDQYYIKKLDEFFNRAICEFAGINKEYVRVNETIRDYMQRTDIKIADKHKSKMNDKLHEFLKDPNIDNYDIPQFLFSMKELLISGMPIDNNYLIPSLYLKTMSELYEKKNNYKDVIKFADRALENESFMDNRIIFEIRSLLCLSLAKLQDKRILDEVQKITGADHHFLLAYYYRQIGKNDKALEQLNDSLKKRKKFAKAKRELVQVYINLQEYPKATELAKENYGNDKRNPYHIHAYFSCLIKSEKSEENRRLLSELLDNMKKITSEKAKDMLLRCEAQFEAFYNDDEENALMIINRSICEYPNLSYARLVKFDICERFNRLEDMKEILSYFEGNVDHKRRFHNVIVTFTAVIMAANHNVSGAAKYFRENIRNYTDQAIERFEQRLMRYN